jgi:hypothetical protein
LITDPINIVSNTKSFLSEVDNLDEQYIFLGVTHFEDEKIRKRQHELIHGQLTYHKTLMTYNSRFERALAETIGIQYLWSIKNAFQASLNYSSGYEVKSRNNTSTFRQQKHHSQEHETTQD